jgi:hypothetical protein
MYQKGLLDQQRFRAAFQMLSPYLDGIDDVAILYVDTGLDRIEF